MTGLRLLHAPLRSSWAREHPHRVATRIRQLRPTFVDLTEAYPDPVRTALKQIDGYDVVVTDGGRDQRRGQYDNPVLVRTGKGFPSVGRGQVFACPAATPDRIAPERWLTFAAARIAGHHRPHCHIGFHPHAGVQGDDGGISRKNDRGQAYLQGVAVLEELLDFIAAQRWTASVGADINVRDIGDDPKLPHRLLRDRGMTVEATGLDLLAASKELRLDVWESEAPAEVTDHPWLLGVAS